MQSIPSSLAPFFQEYDLAKLNPQRDSHTIIERALQFGKNKLPQPHRAFWQIVLDVTE